MHEAHGRRTPVPRWVGAAGTRRGFRIAAACAQDARIRDSGTLLHFGICRPGPPRCSGVNFPCFPCTQQDNRHPEMAFETVWQVPEPLSVCEVQLDDETVSTVRRHGNPNAELRLVISHGNGLAIDFYYPFWSLLAEDFDLAIFDIRNHGWNAVGRRQDHNIPTLIHDHDLILESIDGQFGAKPTVGVFHSIATLVALFSFTDRYSALVLFDPPICKPTGTEDELDDALKRKAEGIRRRGQRFRSLEEFSDLLSYIPACMQMQQGTLELMARTTLRKCPEGQGYVLRCPREYEAQITEYARSFSPLLDLETLTCPTKVIGADPTAQFSYLPTFSLHDILSVDYDFIPDATHFLQMEQPEECVETMRAFLRSHGLE